MGLDLTKHVFNPGEGEVLTTEAPTSGKVAILVDPRNTGDTGLCTLMQTLDPGGVVPVHRHDAAEQVLFIVSGRGKASIADHDLDVCPGTVIHVPRRTWHGFSNTGDEPLQVLETTSPPGFQNAFREWSQLSGPDPEAFAEIAERNDIRIRTAGT